MPRVKSSRNSPSKSPAPQGRAGVVRIISGQWKGRKLPVRDVEGLRPTTDRVKETIFNWLAPHVRGTRCLDLFAGSGGLGLEALSRYAEQVTLIEMDRGAADQLKKNLTTLGSSQGQVIQADAVSWLQGTATPSIWSFWTHRFVASCCPRCASCSSSAAGWHPMPSSIWSGKKRWPI